jgi:V/A-type H+/Na+-transporting ATPase subunit I
MLVIARKKDEEKLQTILAPLGWQDIEIRPETEGAKEDIERDLEAKIAKLAASQEKLAEDSKKIVLEKQGLLIDMWKNLRLHELMNKVESFYGKTSKTMMFSGWIPESKYKLVDSSIKSVSANRCYIEWNDPSEIRKKTRKQPVVPVKFSSPRFLSPFQMLVKGYGMPEYGTVDPTPFVSILYLIMFGLMFGDVGQGLVILLIGVLGTIFLKNKDPGYYSLANLLIWCGASSMVFGALFGSYMGVELLPPLWFNYHQLVAGHGSGNSFFRDIYSVLFLTVIFGISVIGIGLLINWVNLIKKREWGKLFVEKRGLLGGYMYATGIYIGFYMVDHGYKALPPAIELLVMVGIPALIFFIKAPIEFFIHKKHHPELKFTAMTPVNFLLEWFVEMLEIYSGYLSNTLSFMRVAALGIAHVSLVVVFTQLSQSASASPVAGPVLGVLVLVLGHVLIIGLEGLSAGIQSLRLNYYEFFSKYFTSTGTPYAPVTLES